MFTGMLEINEVFGATFQGEGSAAGRHCLFVRTFNCNLECTWCDTAFTWAVTPAKAEKLIQPKVYDKSIERKFMSADDVYIELLNRWDIVNKPTLIVISGGEPMMQAIKLYPLARKLFDLGNKIHIETAGTIAPMAELDACVEQYNISPKLAHSGNIYNKRYKPGVLLSYLKTGRAHFKFVLQNPSDLDEVDYIVTDLSIPLDRIMVMPEGTTIHDNIEVARTIANAALDRGYGLSMRTHVLLWPSIDRGV